MALAAPTGPPDCYASGKTKVSFYTLDEAIVALTAYPDSRHRSVYECPHCGFWHRTSKAAYGVSNFDASNAHLHPSKAPKLPPLTRRQRARINAPLSGRAEPLHIEPTPVSQPTTSKEEPMIRTAVNINGVERLAYVQYLDYRVSFVIVTPEMAAEWRERWNVKNRPRRESRVEAYARDMLAGNWMFTGDTIKVAGELGASGCRILDSQHRLEAIEKSGQAQLMMVVENIDPAAQERMDQNAIRTVADALGLRGEQNVQFLQSIARRVMIFKHGAGEKSITPTLAEITTFIYGGNEGERAARLRNAAHLASYARGKRFPMAGSSLGGAFYLAGEKDPYAAELFFRSQLVDGIEIKPGMPAYVLRERLERMRKAEGHRRHSELDFRLAQVAWNHFRTGNEKMERLQPPRGGWGPYRDVDWR